jgi:hypothetical protein
MTAAAPGRCASAEGVPRHLEASADGPECERQLPQEAGRWVPDQILCARPRKSVARPGLACQNKSPAPWHWRASARHQSGARSPHCASPLPGAHEARPEPQATHASSRCVSGDGRRAGDHTEQANLARRAVRAASTGEARHGGHPVRAAVGSCSCAGERWASRRSVTALVVVATQRKIWLPRIIWGAELRE